MCVCLFVCAGFEPPRSSFIRCLFFSLAVFNDVPTESLGEQINVKPITAFADGNRRVYRLNPFLGSWRMSAP